jgi:hypothetical protein
MTRNTIAASAASTAGQAPGLLTGSLSIATVEESPGQYELSLVVQQLGAGILRAAIVASTTANPTPTPVCLINVQGPIGGPPGTLQQGATGLQYSQSWTQSDVPGVPFGVAGAELQVMVYESDSAAVISATAIF